MSKDERVGEKIMKTYNLHNLNFLLTLRAKRANTIEYNFFIKFDGGQGLIENCVKSGWTNQSCFTCQKEFKEFDAVVAIRKAPRRFDLFHLLCFARPFVVIRSTKELSKIYQRYEIPGDIEKILMGSRVVP